METKKDTRTTLEGLQAELDEIGANQEFSLQSYDIGSKISLITHALKNNPRELGECELDGILTILEEIQKGVSRMGLYCHKAQSYHYYSANPASLIETQKAEAICHGRIDE
jgi:septation ring formation regulator EzrA